MTPKLAFVPLTIDTIEALTDIAPAVEKASLVLPVSRIMAQSRVGQETIAFGVFQGEIPVGIIALEDSRVMDGIDEPQIQNCLFIWQVFVDAKHERRGIGSAMIDFAKSYALNVGLTGVALATVDQSDHTPLPFYEKHGFAPTGRRLQDGPEDLLELVWRPS